MPRALVAFDCLADLECALALGSCGDLNPRPADFVGTWALAMGALMGGLAVVVAVGVARALVGLRWDPPPALAVVAGSLALIALDVALVTCLETLF